MKTRSFLSAILAVALSVMLLFKSADLSDGIRHGLYICSFSVIPSLFPFMALSLFLCKSSASEFLSLLFLPLTKLLKIPSCCGGVLLSSIIGGYPSSAKCIAELVSENKLDTKTASKMLCYCVNAGPAFLISTVGISVFKNIKIGFLLFFAQMISSFCAAFFLSAFLKSRTANYQNPQKTTYPDNASAIISSVVSAAESCFNMCAFIVLSFGMLEVFEDGSIFSAASRYPLLNSLLSGFFEVTSGVLSAEKISGYNSIIAAGAIASFSGISVMLQVASATEKAKIDLIPFIFSRFINAGTTAIILRLFFAFSKENLAVFSIKTPYAEAVLSASAPAAVSLLCMAALFLLSLVPQKSEKEPLFSQIKYKLVLFKHSKTK